MKKAEKQNKTQLGGTYVSRARMTRKVYLPAYEPQKLTNPSLEKLRAYMGEENKYAAGAIYFAMIESMRGAH